MAVPHFEVESRFDVVAFGASLGGIAALCEVLSTLPTFLPCAVLVVQHRAAQDVGAIFSALLRRSKLPVYEASEGDRVLPGRVLLAPSDRHMTVGTDRRIVLGDGPKVQFVRPSVDVLFSSVAEVYRERAIGVVLTGRQCDGAEGVRAIKASGGRVIAQDRTTSLSFDMPRAAIATGCVDFVVPIAKVAPALVALTTVPGAADLFRVPLPAWADLTDGPPR